MSRTLTRTWCGLCHSRCGILLEFEGGRAVAMRGDPDQPTNHGRTCKRGRMLIEHLYHPQRLDHPLKRVGGRGEGQWRRVTWEEAIGEVAERIAGLRDLHGPETLAFSRGTYRTYEWTARRFMNLLGSPNITGANSICHCPSAAIESAVCGAMAEPDLDRCSTLVVWGTGRSVSSPVTHWPAIHAAKRRGARLITVDPRRTKEAAMADIWLAPRPGTDVALMLAWMNVMFEEGLFDRQFVEANTLGADDLRSLAARFTPARAAALCRIPEATIVAAARMYATGGPAAITWSYGIDKQGRNAAAGAHARVALRALTGNLDRQGGDLLPPPAPEGWVVQDLAMECNEALSAGQRRKMLGRERGRAMSFEAWEMTEEAASRARPKVMPPTTSEVVTAHPYDVFAAMATGRPYPVRALICQASNPLMTLADPRRTAEAFRGLDLLVVMDYYMTPTAALADFVFPAASTVERDDIAVSEAGCIAYPKAMEPLAERRSDYEFWMELGRALSQAEWWPWRDAEEVCDHRLAPAGLRFRDLADLRVIRRDGPVGARRESGFATPSGKIELRSSVFERLGCDPLPVFHQPVEEPAYPLVLITGSRFEPMYHSEQRQWAGARKAWPDPVVGIHPDTAAGLGIADGDRVVLETPHGAIRQVARLDRAVQPGCADSQHGWWFPERAGTPEEPFCAFESNANVLCSDAPDCCSAGTGGWALTGVPCRARREEQASGRDETIPQPSTPR